MFPWSSVHVMNVCVDSAFILEDNTNIPIEKLPPPLPLPYPKIYPIIFPGCIRYANTPHFIIVFFDAVHA